MTTENQNTQDSARDGRPRILVVDDEAMILQVFSRIISVRLPDCTVDVAPDGEKAIKSFKSQRQDLVVMDLHMPVMDGKTAFMEIQKLCEAEKQEMPPVLFVTGFSPPNELTKMIGPDSKHGILRKPVTAEVLISSIKTRLPA